MNAKERFNGTMMFKPTDRPPLFEDGIRDEVIRNWRSQGLGKREKLEKLFSFDMREEIEPELEPIPYPGHWPKTRDGLNKLTARMDFNDPRRLPDDWESMVHMWETRDYPLILRVHRGYFLSMGVHGWRRFSEAIQILIDDPKYVENWLATCAELSYQLVDKILRVVQVDAVLFSEPIGGNHGPLISPQMYSSIVLKSYKPVLENIRSHGVPTIIYRTYANTQVLLPYVIEAGFNCLWACETNPTAMDYRQIRNEYGKDLRLIGGIDSDALRQNQAEISRVVMGLVPELLDEGGYIPLADGRVRADVTFGNYTFYRNLLETIVRK